MYKLKKNFLFIFLAGGALLLFQEPAMASLESSLINIKMRLTGVLLPMIAVIGIVFAGFSFITGNPNARQHIIYAVVGTMIGFGAQGIIDFISYSVR